MLLRTKITTAKETVRKVDESICKKLIKVEETFYNGCENVSGEPLVDLYRAELSFLTKCESEFLLQCKYGDLILEYHNEAIKE